MSGDGVGRGVSGVALIGTEWVRVGINMIRPEERSRKGNSSSWWGC